MTVARTRTLGRTDNRWDEAVAGSLSPPHLGAVGRLKALRYRSNLLGSDRAVSNYGGGNTSIKVRERDHTGEEIEVLWVKGSGSDLATMTEKDFTGLRLAEILPLIEREEMSDEDMVAYLSHCMLAPSMPRSSIETLMHSFIPFPHVDHTHADATNMIACAENGERLARECFGDEVIWIPYIRPGFTLAKQVSEAVRRNPWAKLVLLAKHGLITWGESGQESYTRTITAINKAADFVAARRGDEPPFGGEAVAPVPAGRRADIFAAILPTLRGAVSRLNPKILLGDTSDDVLEFVCGRSSRALSQVGAACPDHLIRTKVYPLWIDFDPARDSVEGLRARIVEGVEAYSRSYQEYFERNREALGTPQEVMFDPYPRVVLIAGLGMVGIAQTYKEAALSRDFYHRAIAVIHGASAVDRFVSLTEEESYAIEYWPLELYKLAQLPRPKELTGQIALVTGGAGGIGRAVVEALADEDACVIVADTDADLRRQGGAAGARELAARFPGVRLGVGMDVTEEADVARGFRSAVLAYGGVDIVVCSAGLASPPWDRGAASAPIEETSVELWERNQAVLARGYFLVAREAFRVLRQQGVGGSIVFVASRNGLCLKPASQAPGKNAAAYSTAKAAELHPHLGAVGRLARCLAKAGGEAGIRVNLVNPDAVLQGSRIWDSSGRGHKESGRMS